MGPVLYCIFGLTVGMFIAGEAAAMTALFRRGRDQRITPLAQLVWGGVPLLLLAAMMWGGLGPHFGYNSRLQETAAGWFQRTRLSEK